MARLPPTEKLSLALRKNIRDEWDAKKPDLEKQLSELLGTAWTIDVNPNAIHPYATDDYATSTLGYVIHSYMSDAVGRIKYFEDKFGEEGTAELNTICSSHVLTLDVDEAAKFSYCGCIVRDGKLVVVFKQGNMGVNTWDALEERVLEAALNQAPAPEGSTATMSYTVRTGIRKEYDTGAEECRKKIGDVIAKADIKLNPNFEANYAILKEESKKKKTELRDDWETNLGGFTLKYFEGFLWQLGCQKFADDDMLQEGFQEAVDKGEIAFKIVEKLEAGSYNETLIKDGVCIIQTTPKNFGTNIDYAAEKLVDKL